MCAGAILQSRIDRLIIGAPNPSLGAVGSRMNLLVGRRQRSMSARSESGGHDMIQRLTTVTLFDNGRHPFSGAEVVPRALVASEGLQACQTVPPAIHRASLCTADAIPVANKGCGHRSGMLPMTGGQFTIQKRAWEASTVDTENVPSLQTKATEWEHQSLDRRNASRITVSNVETEEGLAAVDSARAVVPPATMQKTSSVCRNHLSMLCVENIACSVSGDPADTQSHRTLSRDQLSPLKKDGVDVMNAPGDELPELLPMSSISANILPCLGSSVAAKGLGEGISNLDTEAMGSASATRPMTSPQIPAQADQACSGAPYVDTCNGMAGQHADGTDKLVLPSAETTSVHSALAKSLGQGSFLDEASHQACSSDTQGKHTQVVANNHGSCRRCIDHTDKNAVFVIGKGEVKELVRRTAAEAHRGGRGADKAVGKVSCESCVNSEISKGIVPSQIAPSVSSETVHPVRVLSTFAKHLWTNLIPCDCTEEDKTADAAAEAWRILGSGENSISDVDSVLPPLPAVGVASLNTGSVGGGHVLGATEWDPDFLPHDLSIHSNVSVEHNISAAESEALLKGFFRRRRRKTWMARCARQTWTLCCAADAT
jgi:hypothetical protein